MGSSKSRAHAGRKRSYRKRRGNRSNEAHHKKRQTRRRQRSSPTSTRTGTSGSPPRLKLNSRARKKGRRRYVPHGVGMERRSNGKQRTRSRRRMRGGDAIILGTLGLKGMVKNLHNLNATELTQLLDVTKEEQAKRALEDKSPISLQYPVGNEPPSSSVEDEKGEDHKNNNEDEDEDDGKEDEGKDAESLRNGSLQSLDDENENEDEGKDKDKDKDVVPQSTRQDTDNERTH